MHTRPGGPVVAAEKTLRALIAIRREKLLPELYGRVTVAKTVLAALADVMPTPPAWMDVVDDRPGQALPDRLASVTPSEGATLRLAMAIPASLVLIDGPIKEKAKLSFIKCEGAVSILVQAFRAGKLSAVRPMVNALQSLGHADVLPPPEALEAMWKALAAMEE
ncbi:MAG: hypothetical protein K8S99_07300 [Planctomycetes bacterium]|nr:hypothetical protein [Planctomycetota bacterium]